MIMTVTYLRRSSTPPPQSCGSLKIVLCIILQWTWCQRPRTLIIGSKMIINGSKTCTTCFPLTTRAETFNMGRSSRWLEKSRMLMTKREGRSRRLDRWTLISLASSEAIVVSLLGWREERNRGFNRTYYDLHEWFDPTVPYSEDLFYLEGFRYT